MGFYVTFFYEFASNSTSVIDNNFTFACHVGHLHSEVYVDTWVWRSCWIRAACLFAESCLKDSTLNYQKTTSVSSTLIHTVLIPFILTYSPCARILSWHPSNRLWTFFLNRFLVLSGCGIGGCLASMLSIWMKKWLGLFVTISFLSNRPSQDESISATSWRRQPILARKCIF